MSGLSGRKEGQNRPRFGGRPVGKQRTRGFMLTIGFAGTAVLLMMGYLSFNVANTVPGRSYYNVFAELTEADNLANHYEVRIGGRRAGQVLKPEVRNGKARMKLRLDAEFGPLKESTKLRVRLRSAVGVRYMEVTPGTTGKDIPEGGTLPADQTPSVPLDAVLGTFDPKTREGIQFFLTEFGGAFVGNGPRLNQALATAQPFLDDLGSLSKAITDKPNALKRLISGTGRMFAALDPVKTTIADGFAPTADAARNFAETRDGFSSTLEVAPPSFDTLAQRLPSVTRLVNEVDSLARQGRPTLDALPNALARTDRLLVDSQPGLKETDDTLDLVRKAEPPTTKFLRTLQPQLPDVSDLISSLSPTVKHLNPRACELTNFLNGWGNTQKYGNSRGSTQQFILTTPNLSGSGFIGGVPADGIPGLPDKLVGVGQTTPYPGPCRADGSSPILGPEPVTVEESAKGLRYTYNRPMSLGPQGATK